MIVEYLLIFREYALHASGHIPEHYSTAEHIRKVL